MAPQAGAPEPGAVRDMFTHIAPRYDLLNTVMTAGRDAAWRRALVAATAVGPGGRVLDVACGTGKVARDLRRQVGEQGEVVGLDFSEGMLERARRLPGATYIQGDATALPLEDSRFDAATIAFGIRNIPQRGRAFAEMRRVVRGGGAVACLELAQPPGLRGRLFRLIAGRWLPRLGQLAGNRQAYSYLPASILTFPSGSALAAEMTAAGLVEVTWRRLGLGLVTLHVGRVPV